MILPSLYTRHIAALHHTHAVSTCCRFDVFIDCFAHVDRVQKLYYTSMDILSFRSNFVTSRWSATRLHAPVRDYSGVNIYRMLLFPRESFVY